LFVAHAEPLFLVCMFTDVGPEIVNLLGGKDTLPRRHGLLSMLRHALSPCGCPRCKPRCWLGCRIRNCAMPLLRIRPWRRDWASCSRMHRRARRDSSHRGRSSPPNMPARSSLIASATRFGCGPQPSSATRTPNGSRRSRSPTIFATLIGARAASTGPLMNQDIV
jgi:hypothetical protein